MTGAGDIRAIRTGKGDNWFCYPEYIIPQAEQVLAQLAARNHLADVANEDDFAAGAAWFLSEINAVHPFREGNGRIQLVFLTMLARNAGYDIHEDELRPEAFLAAMITSFGGDIEALKAEIRRLL